jgi:hypothetical protein
MVELTVICSPDLGSNRMLVFFDIISIREGAKNEEKADVKSFKF